MRGIGSGCRPVFGRSSGVADMKRGRGDRVQISCIRLFPSKAHASIFSSLKGQTNYLNKFFDEPLFPGDRLFHEDGEVVGGGGGS